MTERNKKTAYTAEGFRETMFLISSRLPGTSFEQTEQSIFRFIAAAAAKGANLPDELGG